MSAPTTWARPRPATVEELRAWPWLPAVITPRAAYLGPTGERLIVDDAGNLNPHPSFGYRSIAADPAAVRGGRR